MDISEKDVRHLAELSKISLSETEIPGMQKDLREILAYVAKLDELELDNVEPTFDVTGLKNVWREDVVGEQIPSQDLLGLAPDKKDNSVKVPKVL